MGAFDSIRFGRGYAFTKSKGSANEGGPAGWRNRQFLSDSLRLGNGAHSGTGNALPPETTWERGVEPPMNLSGSGGRKLDQCVHCAMVEAASGNGPRHSCTPSWPRIARWSRTITAGGRVCNQTTIGWTNRLLPQRCPNGVVSNWTQGFLGQRYDDNQFNTTQDSNHSRDGGGGISDPELVGMTMARVNGAVSKRRMATGRLETVKDG